MDWQTAITVLAVGGCAAHAVWRLLPADLRRRARGGRAPAAGACGGCDGCGSGAPRPAGAAAVIKVLRGPRARR